MNAKIAVLLAAGLTMAGAAWGQTSTPPADGTGGTAGSSDAASAPPPTDAEGEFISEQSTDQIRADSIIGAKVTNAAGDEMGRISDIILDQDGKLSGLVIESGGVLGFGAKRVAISTRSLPAMSDQSPDFVVLGLSSDDLERAPEFKTVEEKQAEMERESFKMENRGQGQGLGQGQQAPR